MSDCEDFTSKTILAPGWRVQQIAREEGQDQIGLVAVAALVDDADAVGVAVVGDAEVGAQLDDLRLQVDDVARVLGVGQVVGEAPVGLAVELDHVAADAAQQLGRVEAGDAVAGVDDDARAGRAGWTRPATVSK